MSARIFAPALVLILLVSGVGIAQAAHGAPIPAKAPPDPNAPAKFIGALAHHFGEVVTAAILSNATTANEAISLYSSGAATNVSEARKAYAAIFHLEVSWSDVEGILLACGIGAGEGALFGAIAGGPVGAAFGAGLGCLIAAGGFALAKSMEGDVASSVNFAIEQAKQNSLTGDMFTAIESVDNLINQTVQLFNATLNAWAQGPEHEALNQLPNSTFNGPFALAQSGLAEELSTQTMSYALTMGAQFNAINQGEQAVYGPGGAGSSTCSFAMAGSGRSGSGVQFGCGAGNVPAVDAYYAHATGMIEASTSGGGTYVWLNKGASLFAACPSGANAYTVNNPAGAGEFALSQAFPASAVARQVSNTTDRLTFWNGSACDLTGIGFIVVPTSPTSPTTALIMAGCGLNGANPTCNPFNSTSPGWTPAKPTISNLCVEVIGSGCSVTYPKTGRMMNAWAPTTTAVMYNAETKAQTYWLFLHLLGYTNANQIPSNCLIPLPDWGTPAGFSNVLGNLTVNQTLALYQAALNGLATFFDHPDNATNFCSGHQTFHFSNTQFTSTNVVTFGFVLTLPKGGQVLGTRSTWTVNNGTSTSFNVEGNSTTVGAGNRADPAPIVLWPSTKTIVITTNTVQEIPTDDPIYAYSPLNGTLYLLYGNGTPLGSGNTSTGTVSSSAGAAIYLTFCAVNVSGVWAIRSKCPLTLTNLTTMSQQAASGTGGSSFVFTGGCAGDSLFLIGGLVDGIAGPLSGIPLIGAAACDIAWVIAFVIVIVIVALISGFATRAIGLARGSGRKRA